MRSLAAKEVQEKAKEVQDNGYWDGEVAER